MSIDSAFSVIQTLSNINRFSNLRNNKEQNVADHSYRVTMLTMMICDDYNKRLREKIAECEPEELESLSNCPKINTETAMRYSLFHDLEEAYVGDIPYPFKSSKYYQEDVETRFVNEQFSGNEVLKSYSMYILQEKKAHTQPAWEVMKFCDMLDLVYFCYDEIFSGNTHMHKVFTTGMDVCLQRDRELNKLTNGAISVINPDLMCELRERKREVEQFLKPRYESAISSIESF